MKIRIDLIIKKVDGVTPIPNPDVRGAPMTLRDVCINSILTLCKSDGERKKRNKWRLFKKLRVVTGEIELTEEEIRIIKKSIARLQPPLVMGQCFEMLENNT